MSRPALTVISDAGLPAYPLPHDFRMPTHYFMTWWHSRWLNSTLHLTGSYEVQGVALALYCIAQAQAPIGTLPRDDALIARLLRLDLQVWVDLQRRSVPPLHGWYLADCEGEVRWAHPVVLEMILDAKNKVEIRRMSNDDRAVQKRIERLRKALGEMGVDNVVLDDRLAMEAIDEWLEVNWKKRRNALVYSRALRWAGSEGILSRSNKINGLH